MPKLFSNPWKDRTNVKHKVKYGIRNQFYKWLLKKYCKDCKTVMDIACGPGHFMKLAEKMGYEAYGLELDERYAGKNVIMEDLWDHNGKYDVVFNSFIMEHVDDHEKYVQKMASLSNDIVITISAYMTRHFWDVPDHKRPVTKVSGRWLFRRAGFRNLLSIEIPFFHATVIVSKRVKDTDTDEEAKKIRAGFW